MLSYWWQSNGRILSQLHRLSISRDIMGSSIVKDNIPKKDSLSIGDLSNLGLHSAQEANVLVVGDGNCSFSRSFMETNLDTIKSGNLKLMTSSLDTREELLEMYHGADEILRELEKKGVTILHGVNATRLETYDCFRAVLFDRIVFNFPHYAEGGNKRNKIDKHRSLLRDFFQSASQRLTPTGQIWVTLCSGQGGTPVDSKQRSWGDTWQITHCAAESGFILLNAHVCPIGRLASKGYTNVGYRLQEKGFWTSDSVTHVFCREILGISSQFPIQWTRDISFWVNDGFTESFFYEIVRKNAPNSVSFSVNKFDEYKCQRTGKISVSYRMDFQSSITAFSKSLVNSIALNSLNDMIASPFATSREER